MIKNKKAIIIFLILYTASITGATLKLFDIEEFKFVDIFILSMFLYSPVFLFVKNGFMEIIKTNLYCSIGFIISFIVIGQSNIWPLSLVFWFVALLPGIILINSTSLIINRYILEPRSCIKNKFETN